MISAQSPSTDFNQMLVVSVFFHFFLFTVFMFLPQNQDVVKLVKPAFVVSFVDIPRVPDIQHAPPMVEKPIESLPPKTHVAKKPIPPKPKPTPKPKPVSKKPIPKPKLIAEKPVPKLKPTPKLKPVAEKSISKPKPIPKSKSVSEKSTPKPKLVSEKPTVSKALVSKLDQLAQLDKQTIPKKDQLAMAIAKPKEESILEDFNDMKMKTEAEKKSARKKIAKDDLMLKELEFERLSKQSASHQSQNNPPKTSSLLKELDELDRLNKQSHASLSKPKIEKTDFKAAELLKQLESIKGEGVQIKIDMSKLSSQHSQKFKSGIRDLTMEKIKRIEVAPTASNELGGSSASELSLYLGLVQTELLKQWKDPIGGGNGVVQVSFIIFPKGNIAMPKILKSSGNSKLDNLAIRAIKNSVFSPFPKGFKEPNLPFVVTLNYVPKN